ncbi:Ribosomal protein S18 acetylase RimI [Singulisphaera sp. GP187]|uniref:GNAT family N-acetyltransferase n=1 Tax=Singulisphaera sp. GP187 TaxID=1882752 RepID=UPI00092877DE|nr:GNAT family N-acetyltransferase [Singulisphaera sp. GP187]SIN89339.1 Ribosomal protein S18 acetylase RimI [Singulisphaera sp. GP187]
MIRDAEPEDTSVLIGLAQATHVFKPHELVALSEVLNDYHVKERENGHRCIAYSQDNRTVGFAYYAPASMTDQGWYLYWIAVEKGRQARGIGSELLAWVEADIRRQEARLLLIETSSLPHYESTRRFYLKHGYVQAGVLADFYADGDDLVVYCKRFKPRRIEG